MPEIIEVKKYIDFINKFVKNKQLLAVNIKNGRYHKHKPFENYDKLKKELPIKLLEVNSKGKFIYFTFENNFYLLNTLGLSGGWAFIPNNSTKYKIPKLLEYIGTDNINNINNYLESNLKHINVEFIFSSGKLVFFDTLSFGTLKVEIDINLL